MAGIYIHIPFCRQACHYCNFHFTVNQNGKEAFVDALLKEITLQKNYLEGEKIETVYFGGGTPSLLSGDEVKRILDALHRQFVIVPGAEVTLEANPDDLEKKKISELKTTAVNRFSIGVQSFQDDDLKYLHRAHNAQQADYSIKLAQDAGFENITIDLIYGIPEIDVRRETLDKRYETRDSGLVTHDSRPTTKKFLQNLQKLSELGIPHFSAYCLTVEPKTALDKFIREKKMPDVNDAQAAQQFEQLMDFAEANNYEHYEISNFCKPGIYSKHNTSYWTGKKYLGLGPSAHSFDSVSRQWNISNNTLYVQSLSTGELNFEKETLTENNRFNEYIMTALRTKWGVDKNLLKEKFGEEHVEQFEKNAEPFFENQSLQAESEKIILTRKGKLIADKIISELFETD